MRLFALLLVMAVWGSVQAACVPPTMTYQGIFTDGAGNIMPDGEYEIGFHIFPGPVGGPPMWSEFRTITVVDGLFEIVLGEIIPLGPMFFPAAGSWLALSYDETFLEPRQEIHTVPYAYRTCWADSARGAAMMGPHTAITLTANQDSVRTALEALGACCDTNSADIDTIKQRLDVLEQSGIAFGTGGFADGVTVDDEASEEELVIESGEFNVTGNAAVHYSATASVDEISQALLLGQLELVRVGGTVTGISITTQVLTPSDLLLQTLETEVTPGTYFLRLTMWTDDVEESVLIDEVEFNALWVPMQPSR